MLTSLTAQVFEKEVKSYVYYCEGGPQCKMQLPKDDIKTMTLMQPFLVFQLFLPLGQSFSFELSVSDTGGTRRRLVFSTAFTDVKRTPLHCQIPLATVRHGVWLNLAFSMADLVMRYFSGQTFKSVDLIALGTCCKLRKLFTLKSPPLTTEGDPLDLIGAEPIPKNCDFAPGTECLTVLFDAQQIVSDSVSIASDWRPSSEPESLNMTPGSSGDLSSLSRRLTSTAKCGYEGPMGLAFGSRVPLGSIPAVPQAKAEGEDPMPSPGKGPSRRTARQGTAGSKGSSALPPASPLDSTSHNSGMTLSGLSTPDSNASHASHKKGGEALVSPGGKRTGGGKSARAPRPTNLEGNLPAMGAAAGRQIMSKLPPRSMEKVAPTKPPPLAADASEAKAPTETKRRGLPPRLPALASSGRGSGSDQGHIGGDKDKSLGSSGSVFCMSDDERVIDSCGGTPLMGSPSTSPSRASLMRYPEPAAVPSSPRPAGNLQLPEVEGTSSPGGAGGGAQQSTEDLPLSKQSSFARSSCRSSFARGSGNTRRQLYGAGGKSMDDGGPVGRAAGDAPLGGSPAMEVEERSWECGYGSLSDSSVSPPKVPPPGEGASPADFMPSKYSFSTRPRARDSKHSSAVSEVSDSPTYHCGEQTPSPCVGKENAESVHTGQSAAVVMRRSVLSEVGRERVMASRGGMQDSVAHMAESVESVRESINSMCGDELEAGRHVAYTGCGDRMGSTGSVGFGSVEDGDALLGAATTLGFGLAATMTGRGASAGLGATHAGHMAEVLDGEAPACEPGRAPEGVEATAGSGAAAVHERRNTTNMEGLGSGGGMVPRGSSGALQWSPEAALPQERKGSFQSNAGDMDRVLNPVDSICNNLGHRHIYTPPVIPASRVGEDPFASISFRDKKGINSSTQNGKGDLVTDSIDGDCDLDLLYDPILNFYYDPRTNKYYELL
ncbi:hypothetical protein CYMTET_30317 [Cymbomonas tetramitiformis]|uniref:CFA20 domain-containing protein n=1 Tax=Cymbomonas tetramitiformis TaxID=36881 RepID=A0AAE0FJJ4_9CHLO|nr:hypothetical protein CYMTET_30317 [Cymbomonas tetramitiformis]